MLIKQNWIQLTLIQLGGVICLPMILVGTFLAQKFGFEGALIGIVLGNLFLFALAVPMTLMAVQNRKTTMENAKEYFGDSGGVLFASVMALSLTGWFAIQLNMISLSLNELFAANPLVLNLAVGSMITITALKGIRSLSLLSDLSAPLLVATLIYAVWNREGGSEPASFPLNLGALSLVIAATISAVVDIPTYYRHAISKKEALISVACLFCLVIPLTEIVGVYLAAEDGGNILQILKGNGEVLVGIWVALFIVLAGWTTNATNLFSNVACLETLFPKLNETTRVLIMGAIGTCLACLNLLNHFELILELMGIAVTAMGAVIIASFIKQSKGNFRQNFIFWALGSLAGYLTVFEFASLTTVSQLDAFLISGGAATLLKIGMIDEKIKAK